MATSILVCTLPVRAATQYRYDSTLIPQNHHNGRRCRSRATSLIRTPTLSSSTSVATGRELGFSNKIAFLSQARRGVLLKAQENEEGGVDDAGKPFYAASEFWIQVAVVILTVGFVDAGYSGDWTRIGAISRETEAQLRIGAYLVVPISAVLVWAIGKRRETP